MRHWIRLKNWMNMKGQLHRRFLLLWSHQKIHFHACHEIWLTVMRKKDFAGAVRSKTVPNFSSVSNKSPIDGLLCVSAQTLRTPGDLVGSGNILWKWLCHNWLFRKVALYSLQLLLMRGASWTQFFLLRFHFILSVRLKSINTGSFWIAGLSVNCSQIRRVRDAASKGKLSAVFYWSELGLEFWPRYSHIDKYLLQRRRR